MKRIRIRVITGYTEDGSAIVKRLSAYDELTLSDSVVRAVVESGRIAEFLNDEEITIPAKIVSEKPPEPAKTPFNEYAENWKLKYKMELERTSIEHIKSKVNVLNRFFGEMMIEDITPDDVKRFIAPRKKEGRAKKTIKEDLANLKEILDTAVHDDGLIVTNPARDRNVKNTAKPGKGTKALTREQAADIQAHIPMLADPRERCLMALLAYTSCRREELLGLKWSAVDFKAHKIHIQEAVVYVNSEVIVKDTKTTESERSLPMCEELEQILAGCRQESGYVLTDENGEQLTRSRYYTMWKKMTSHIELYGMTARNFRTSFATFTVASGVDLKSAQSLMGHSGPDMILKVYAKQEQTALDQAVGRINAYISA